MKTAPGAATETASFVYQTNLISSLAVAGSPARALAMDAKKNTINNGRGVFAYDLKNNLIQATVNGVVSTYAFDALNQRVSKTVGGVVKRFIYDEAGGLAGEYDGSGSAQVKHVYFGDLPVGVSVGGAIHRVHTDYLGTPRVVTQGSAIVWKWASTDPFGGNAPSVASVVYNPRFPGQYFDAETGLHHNKHRAYDPQLGRYMQPDPLGLAAGKNPFNYVNQNPLNGTDPEGLQTLQFEKMRPYKLSGSMYDMRATRDPGDDGIIVGMKIPVSTGGEITAFVLSPYSMKNRDNNLRNCHGVTFGEGRKIIIDVPEVPNVLRLLHYRKLDSRADVRVGDVAVYTEKNPTGAIDKSGKAITVTEAVHSVTVREIRKNGDIVTRGKGGWQPESTIGLPLLVGPGRGTAWGNKDAEVQYWRAPANPR